MMVTSFSFSCCMRMESLYDGLSSSWPAAVSFICSGRLCWCLVHISHTRFRRTTPMGKQHIQHLFLQNHADVSAFSWRISAAYETAEVFIFLYTSICISCKQWELCLQGIQQTPRGFCTWMMAFRMLVLHCLYRICFL